LSSGGPGNQRRTPSREKYERVNNSHEEVEMQHNVSNIPPDNAAPDKNIPVEGPDEDDVFNIPHKNAPLDKLRKWRRATLALNASRRFRYTLDLKRAKERARDSWRSHTHAVRAATRFRLNRTQEEAPPEAPPKAPREASPEAPPDASPEAPPEGYGIGPLTLAILVSEQNIDALKQKGGVNGVANLLHTDIEKGIKEDPKEFENRRNAFGENTYPRKAARNFWVFVWEAFHDKTLIILMVCATVSLALGIKTEGFKEGWFDGGSIFFAVLLVIFVTAISDYRQSLHFQNLNEEKRDIQLQVIRGGRRQKISIFNLVVGDVVPLNIGDQVPADGILITGHSLSIDESSMTGESNYVDKDQKDPFMLSGCKVADGYGTMLVTGVGLNTEWGVLMASISEDNGEETPLQVRLNGVATFIGKAGVIVAVLVFVIVLIRFFTGHTEDSNGKPLFQAGKTKVGDIINEIVKIFAIAVTIVVVAVPEGLPLAVTLTLAYSMKKMMADKALVRRLSACETMGSATIICSDKTGTLTMNQMTVVQVWIAGKIRESPDSSEGLPFVVQSLLFEGISHNTTGSVFKPEVKR
jgi:Ca2+-transporting ATPase